MIQPVDKIQNRQRARQKENRQPKQIFLKLSKASSP
jgi:hypothetical protein